MKTDPNMCCESVATQGLRTHYHQCTKKVVTKVGNKSYCKIHDPAYMAVKHEEQKKKWDKEWEEQTRKHEARQQDSIDAARYRFLRAKLDCFTGSLAFTRYRYLREGAGAKLDAAIDAAMKNFIPKEK